MTHFDGLKRRKTRIGVGITAVFLLLVGAFFMRDRAVLSQEPIPLESGEGSYDPGPLDHITETQRQEIQKMLDTNMLMLAKNGNLPTPNLTAQVSFAWPLKLKAGLRDPGYHGISGFVDHNPAYPNQLKDYMCQNRTYDTSSGYNHKGTDYFLWPFEWHKVNGDEVEIIAAAPGTIIGKQDGNNDRNCNFNNNSWNAVYVQHADGSVAWYGHMKKNSLTTKAIGQTVATGEYLGIVGSSGNSTGPHLHFEVYRSASYQASNLIDPYAGSCKSFNGRTSWWIEQRPYYDSAINKLMTASDKVEFLSCPNPAITNEKTHFLPGDSVYFYSFFRDQRIGQSTSHRVYWPDGSITTTWTKALTNNWSWSYHYQSWQIPNNAPEGQWRYEVEYEGVTYRQTFMVGEAHNYLPLIKKDPTPTPTATFTPTPTLTPTPTFTPTMTPTATLEATVLPTTTEEP